MKLTEAQRWILINQYEILAHLDPKQSSRYEDAIEALQNGYELDYRRLSGITKETLPAKAAREVRDVLNLYRAITNSYKDLEDKTGIDPSDIEFPGFDGNDEEEGRLYLYTEWYLNLDGGRYFPELNKANDCNSHRPMLATYRRMLAAWREMGQPQHISNAQLRTLIGA
jgi:uncharacterized protein